MSSRATVVGLLVLAALGAFVWFYEIEGAPERERAESAEARIFPTLEASEVVRFVLTTSDASEVEVARRDGRWRLVSPVDARADGQAAEAVADALAALESEAVYDETETLDAYGLDASPLVRFETAEGTFALRVGDTAPVGGGSYVTDTAGERVWLVPAYQLSAFRRTLAQLRDARVVDLDPNAARTLTVASENGRVELVRSDGEGDWTLQHPIEAPARQATVEDLLSDLEYLRADRFIDDPTPEQRAGFEAPKLRVRVGLEDGETVDFAVATESTAGMWLARGAEGVVSEIESAAWQDLPRSVQAFRFRELANFTPSEVERFSLTFRDGDEEVTVDASRTSDRDWAFKDEALTGGAASRLLSELSRLEGTEIVAESMGAAELAGLGLAPPRVRVRAFDASGASLADVAIGDARSDGAFVAMRDGSPLVHALAAEVASEIPVGLAAYREGFRREPEPEVDPAADPDAEADPDTGAGTADEAPPAP